MKVRHRADTVPPELTFPGYGDVSEIAVGTFATVYRATELGTGRAVALKVVRVAETSPHILEGFKKELSALALLSNHPNVTTLYRTFFTPEGRPVLVLELCRGSLAQVVRDKGPLRPREAVAAGVKVAGALETAHRSGFLHRDLKPQNILVSQFGEPVLADFGVAALQTAAQSTEGLFGFTTLHAAPEVLEGLPGSPAADIYGLASSLYQLLLGKGPFAAYEGEAPASVILRILRDPAPRPPVASVPVALADLLAACLDKDPARRPTSAGELAEGLRDVEAAMGWPQTPYVVWGDDRTLRGEDNLARARAARTDARPSGAAGGGADIALGQPLSPLPRPLFPPSPVAPQPVPYLAAAAQATTAARPLPRPPGAEQVGSSRPRRHLVALAGAAMALAGGTAATLVMLHPF